MIFKHYSSIIKLAGSLFIIILLLEYYVTQKNKSKKIRGAGASVSIDKVDDDIKLLCVVFCSKRARCRAVADTWSERCDGVLLRSGDSDRGLRPEEDFFDLLGPQRFGPFASSFQRLCEYFRDLVENFSSFTWCLFVKDDTFAVPENAKWLITYLRKKFGNETHYLGHGRTLWGTDYNWAGAGYVLSMRAMTGLAARFNSSSACAAGGKYWKQEDYYLGKHLNDVNIHPVDTRDDLGFSTFLGYDLEKMMFPGSNTKFSSYYSKSLYPVECCGSKTVTFPVLSYTDLYKFYYMMYGVKLHSVDDGKDRFPKRRPSEDYVWKDFLVKEKKNINMSAKEYENLWYVKFGNATSMPITTGKLKD